MPVCERCGRTPALLARTATRVWLGCRRCHRTWSLDLDQFPSAADEPASSELDTTPSRLGRALLVAALGVGIALGLRILLKPVLGTASPFLLFTPAVAIAAVYGGVFPGI